MTISILVFDAETGRFGGAAATGSLCVGGWVLRGAPDSGLSASQGSLPSTMWGEDVLTHMRGGVTASEAVATVTAPDEGRHHRQLAALDPSGGTGAFTGSASLAAARAHQAASLVCAGNMLTSEAVIDACVAGYMDTKGALDLRLLAALDAAAQAGGDSRGFLSAALLVVSHDAAPLSLRIDRSNSPLAELRALHAAATTGAYADWASLVPTLDHPHRADPYPATSGVGVKAATTPR